jgi:hypothetical protein
MRSELSGVRGLLDGFRLERDRALADFAAQMVQDAETDMPEALDRAGEGRGRLLRRALAGLAGRVIRSGRAMQKRQP